MATIAYRYHAPTPKWLSGWQEPLWRKPVLKPPELSLLGEGELEELREGSKHPLVR